MSDCRTVYRGIIDEVVTNSRPEFVQEGVDEAVLEELRVLWEEKLQQSGVLAAAPPRPVPTMQPGYSYPAQYQQSYYAQGMGRGPAQLGRPPTYNAMPGIPSAYARPVGAQQMQPQSAAPSGVVQSSQGYPAQGYQQMARPRPQYTSPAAYAAGTAPQGYLQAQPAPRPQAGGAGISYQQQPQPQAQMQAPHYRQQQVAGAGPYQQAPPSQGQAQGAYTHSHQRSTQPAQPNPVRQSYPYGAGHPSQAPQQPYSYQQGQAAPQLMHSNHHPPAGGAQAGGSGHSYAHAATAGVGGAQPQQDQLGMKRRAEDVQDSGRAKQQQTGSHGPIYQLDGANDKEEKSGDEEEAVDNLSDVASSNEADEEIAHQCLSQFTKVQRTKNRWKCFLSAGVMNLNGRDHVFNTAQGEFQF